MPHTHHSHSGTFCAHADPASTLPLMIATARSKGMTTLCLTEHAPRVHSSHLYPEEVAAGITPDTLRQTFSAYVVEAQRLIDEAAAEDSQMRMEILLGFEAEWIEAAVDAPLVLGELRALAAFDLVVGSVHHVGGVPIDFSREVYEQARRQVEGDGSDDALFAAYFDAQAEMLRALRPTTVGHFDLVRLWADRPDVELRGRGCGVWEKVVRNLKVAREVGSLLEVNTSGWRKGLAEPYPRAEVLTEWVCMGGQVVLSDDSHAVAHVGTNYERLVEYLERAGVEEVAYLSKRSGSVRAETMSLDELKKHRYWR